VDEDAERHDRPLEATAHHELINTAILRRSAPDH
jgi:hypothetical protein